MTPSAALNLTPLAQQKQAATEEREKAKNQFDITAKQKTEENQSRGRNEQEKLAEPSILEKSSGAAYKPPGIGSKYSPKWLRDTQQQEDEVTKKPNLIMQLISRGGRYLVGAGAALSGLATAVTMFLFSAKTALIFGLPTLCFIAAFIALKPKDELRIGLSASRKQLLDEILENKPEQILSKTEELTNILKNFKRYWAGLKKDQKAIEYQKLQALEKILEPHLESYAQAEKQGAETKEGLYQNCSFAKLSNLKTHLNEVLADIGSYYAKAA